METLINKSESNIAQKGYVPFLCVLGAYLNSSAYGFEYPNGPDYNLLLPLTNWLRNPTLYPGDPMREAFTRFPSVYWLMVSKLSSWFNTEHVLFALFLITKLIFFLAVGRLIATTVRTKLIGVCIVGVIALSPLLNIPLPIGGAPVLTKTSEHALLAVALLFLAGTFLIERRWWIAVLIAASSIYIDAIPLLQTLFGFAAFALIDWRERKRQVLGSGLLGVAICIPWLIISRTALAVSFPRDYMQTLWMFYPFGLTLRFTPLVDLLKPLIILVSMVWMCLVATKAGLDRYRRLELFALFYFVPILLGFLFGDIYIMPSLARLQLMRADTFLLLYAMLLIQVYGANLLASGKSHKRVTTYVLGILSILLPLSIRFVAPALIFVLILWADPIELFERFCHRIAEPLLNLFFLIPMYRSASVVCGLAIVLAFLYLIPAPLRLWNFAALVGPDKHACYEIQQWARENTPKEARFLVPPVGCGFRSFSERSSYGEWVDGVIAVHYPPFGDVFLQRMAAFGFHPGPKWQRGGGEGFMNDNYQRQSWDHLRAISMENRLDYIVQFRNVRYPAKPVFENERYAIYSANQ